MLKISSGLFGSALNRNSRTSAAELLQTVEVVQYSSRPESIRSAPVQRRSRQQRIFIRVLQISTSASLSNYFWSSENGFAPQAPHRSFKASVRSESSFSTPENPGAPSLQTRRNGRGGGCFSHSVLDEKPLSARVESIQSGLNMLISS